MKRAAVLSLMLVLGGIAACDEEGSDRPGNPAVYDRIDSLTDCDELQAEFDAAAENNDREEPGSDLFDATLGYMNAADERLEELGCY